MTTPVGYFAWVRTQKGSFAPEKYAAQRLQMNTESGKHYQRITAVQHPLSEHDWSLSLDELALKYPAPVEAGDAVDRGDQA